MVKRLIDDVLAGVVGILVVLPLGLLVAPGDPPPRCADVVMRQLYTTSIVKGALRCLSGPLLEAAIGYGISTDQDLANSIGHNGSVKYLGQRTESGGYIYEAELGERSFTYVVLVDSNGLVYDVR
jgi:hypothetical protein